MSKRQREQPQSSKIPRVEEDDDLDDYEIEIDHPETLTVRQKEFADQFLTDYINEVPDQTLDENYVEPRVMLGWNLERIREEEFQEAKEAEKAQEDDEREEHENIEEIEEEEQEEEEEEEEEGEEGNEEVEDEDEDIVNNDGEISQSTKEILDIVYGENIIDP